jgi:hypothetical protein
MGTEGARKSRERGVPLKQEKKEEMPKNGKRWV